MHARKQAEWVSRGGELIFVGALRSLLFTRDVGAFGATARARARSLAQGFLLRHGCFLHLRRDYAATGASSGGHRRELWGSAAFAPFCSEWCAREAGLGLARRRRSGLPSISRVTVL